MSALPVCRYGASCYRKNPQHFLEFAHPWRDDPNNNRPAPSTAPSPPPAVAAQSVAPLAANTASPVTPTLPVLSLATASPGPVSIKQTISQPRDPAPMNAVAAATPIRKATATPRFEGSGPFTLCLPPLGVEFGGIEAADSAAALARALDVVQLPPSSSTTVVVPEGKHAARDALRRNLPTSISVEEGTLARPRSHLRRHATALVCETTWRYKVGISPTTRAIAQRGGAPLLNEAAKLPVPAAVSSATAVVLEATSELRIVEGVQHVILVVSPNLANESKPDRIQADTQEDARKIAHQRLVDAYVCLLSVFADAASKLPQEEPANNPRHVGGGWANALLPYVHNPERHPTAVLEYDADLVVIKDAYPKARHHYLILPRRSGLPDSVGQLDRTHLPLLRHMEDTAKSLARKIPMSTFCVGFHSVPSMHHLHLHVISDDFDVPGLKTKKHWLSFTSAFFLPLSQVISDLSAAGRVSVHPHAETLLEGPLACHKCAHIARNMPDLKHHISSHT